MHTDIYQTQQTHYEVKSGSVDIPLSIEKNGIKLTKTYSIDANSYIIPLTDSIQNNTNVLWQGQQYKQLQRTDPWFNNTLLLMMQAACHLEERLILNLTKVIPN